MIKIIIENVHIHVNSTDDLKKVNPWFTLKDDKTKKSADTNVYTRTYSNSDTGTYEPINKSFSDMLDELPKTQISELAEQYTNELNSKKVKFPSDKNETKSIEKTESFVPDSDGLYDLKEYDHLKSSYDDMPDVEIITDEYEKQMQGVVERANLRYALYQQSKSK